MGMDGDKSLKVNEAKFKFARTFLSEYWVGESDFAIETKKNSFFSILKRAWKATLFSPLSTLSSVIVVSASLLILTLILVFDLNIKRLLDEVGGSDDALLYFSLNASKDSYAEVEAILKTEFHMQDVKLVLKDEALKSFSENLGNHSGILGGLEGNPLPDSLEFKLPSDLTPENRESFLAHLQGLSQKFNQIDELVVGAPWANTAKQLRVGVQKLSFVVLGLVFGVVAFIVSNVVRLMLYGHREEIEIMQLVGAPRHRVVLPYLISGALQGVLGAMTALIGTYAIYSSFLQPLNSYLIFGLSYEVFKFIGFSSIFIVLLLGFLLGVGGGWFALRKWVN